MLGELTPLEQTRAYREIVEKNQPIWIEEGRQEGRQREASALILRQIQRRFGTLAAPQRARVQALPVEPLEDLGEALLDFTAPADLDAWLGEHPQPSKAD
jgi:predicted transposase YdaD